MTNVTFGFMILWAFVMIVAVFILPNHESYMRDRNQNHHIRRLNHDLTSDYRKTKKTIGMIETTTRTIPATTSSKSLNPIESTTTHHPFIKTLNNAPKCTLLSSQDINYTLATHCSEDRLWMMEHHCKRWGYDNPISLAMYTKQSVENIYSILEKLGCHREHLMIQIISQEENNTKDEVLSLNTQRHTHKNSISSLLSTREGSAYDYPINKLRNMAVEGVKTSHVLVLDIDFWESINLYNTLNRNDVRKALAADDKLAIVVPAFQLRRGCECLIQRIEEVMGVPIMLSGSISRNQT
mmetsp:Transcript_24368/g.28227  ORF Transcript_24368/g.28227 Transcript_24368/m.28227 type:complete len:296 (-) Transcript_24368:738-1625(-)